MWFQRAYYNAEVVYPRSVSYSNGWSIGGWFVPVLSFVYPYVIMREIWFASVFYLYGEDEGRTHFPKNTIKLWWAGWLILNVLFWIVNYFERHASNLDDFRNYYIVHIVTLIFGTGVLLILRRIVAKFSIVEDSILVKANEHVENDGISLGSTEVAGIA